MLPPNAARPQAPTGVPHPLSVRVARMAAEEPKTPKQREARLNRLLPDGWQGLDGDGIASAYSMPGVSLADLSPPFGIDLGEACVLMGWFELPLLALTPAFHYRHDGRIQVNVGGQEGQKHPQGPTSLFVTRLASNDEQGLSQAHMRIHEAVGLLSAVESMLLAWTHLEDYRFSFADGMLHALAVSVFDPTWAIEASLDSDARSRWQLGASALTSSPERERIALSLRWYDEAKREGGVDAFLKFWFALETLAMPDDTDIRPIREDLRAIYEESAADVEPRFGIGRLFGLRSRIVHHGLRAEISPALLVYMNGVYVDLLAKKLGFTSSRSAGQALEEAGGILNALPKVVGGRGEEAFAARQRDAMERALP